MNIVVDIPEEELKETLLNVIAKQYYYDYSSDRKRVDGVVADQIRKIIYGDKERIINMIVSRASSHLENKAVKKLLEGLKE